MKKDEKKGRKMKNFRLCVPIKNFKIVLGKVWDRLATEKAETLQPFPHIV